MPFSPWTLLVCLSAPMMLVSEKEGELYTNAEIGITLRLPGEEWKLKDMSQGAAKVLVFTPKPDISTRCSVLYMPCTVLPKGMLTREELIKSLLGTDYKRVAYEPDTLAGRKVDRLEYAFKGTTTIEYGLRDGDFWFVFQLSAPDKEWGDAEAKRRLEAIAASLQFTGTAHLVLPEADRSTAAQVHARRQAVLPQPNRDFELTHHDLALEIDPEHHTLKAQDRLTVRSKTDDLDTISLYYSVVSVDRVSGPEGLEFSWEGDASNGPGVKILKFSLSMPLKAGEQVVFTIQTSSEDFFEAVEQHLVQEIAVQGQVRAKSSYSSHVFYYPVDQVKDAAMDIRLTVPSGYTAVSGGLLVGTESCGSETTFHYRTEDRRPRLLPFGFAVGRYISQRGSSDAGLQLTVYGYPGEEMLIRQRVDVAVESANVFERMMGPLPWKDVQFAHVTPERKETAVSLPGLILLSDGCFRENISAADMSDGQFNRPDVLGLISVTDELSHQWNGYAANWPNELAEGVSTYTNCLFVEHRHGRDAYRRSIRFCRDAYLASVKLAKDVAIADPAVYETTAYRGIAFCKTPVILDMLRTELGDERFFAAWQQAFRQSHADQDGYETLQDACSSSAGKDLSQFFDQWFFLAGYPHIALDHEMSEGGLSVTVRQVQPGEPYHLKSELLVRGRAGETIRHPVELKQAETHVLVPCKFEVIEVIFDPDDLVLKEAVVSAAGEKTEN
jgi:aminopeptidase N